MRSLKTKTKTDIDFTLKDFGVVVAADVGGILLGKLIFWLIMIISSSILGILSTIKAKALEEYANISEKDKQEYLFYAFSATFFILVSVMLTFYVLPILMKRK
jgi:uncharacterized BrkB/YihY/UPF0761 family membrane protein